MDQKLGSGEAEDYRCGAKRQVVFVTSVKVRVDEGSSDVKFTLVVKCAGTRSAGKPHATCDVAGSWKRGCTSLRARPRQVRPYRDSILRNTAPITGFRRQDDAVGTPTRSKAVQPA
jgi:hypothetical protein